MKKIQLDMKFKVLYLIFFFTVQTLISCDKFLDEKSDSSVVIPNSLKDLQALLDAFNVMNLAAVPGLIEMNTDDYYISEAVYNSLSEFEKQTYRFDAEPQFLQTNINLFWRNPFSVIFYANTILDRLKNMDGQERVQYKNIKGAALFFRAYTFYQLAQVYCLGYNRNDENFNHEQLGLPLRLEPNFEDKSVRSTLSQTYLQILKDLEEAVVLLPPVVDYTTRPSTVAALALLARVNLSMENYEAALEYAEKALQLNDNLMDYKIRNLNSTTPFEIMNPETIFAAFCTSLPILNPIKANVDSVLYKTYQDGDVRKQIFFNVKTDGSVAFKGNYAGFYNQSFFTGLAVDELFLIKAECLARMSQLELAKMSMKTLLDKKYFNPFTFPENVDSPEEVLAYILQERRKQLLFRGVRWSDIKRLNRDPRFAKDIVREVTLDGSVKTCVQPINDKKSAFFLPQDVINITGMVQNPR